MSASAGSRLPYIAGAVVVAGAGYYLYTNSGDIGAAERAAKADAHRLQARVTGDAKSVEAQGKATFESALADAKSATRDLQGKLGSLSARVESESESAYNAAKAKASDLANKASTEADKAASSAKSGWSSWFGGK
ncbi:hypothetical protein OC834_002285 [Tilletia horrida]|uniref:Calcofluor white hypersensitive protein n=1 Tax=Tilletia horrida TaxID=155126 RepID=A0AAN6JRA8_9BASI|nr:hypothetical protein OC842_003343 [Tilletia horrida]KAK0533297.1 hypothetical protein OC834_002285 [Tilletia horrida]KAK0538170.1 hypothetical protein OC835_001527 [Tilletia horrida]KAK0559001.1 hypothetical protein OC844_004723 [Tilletia horrida]